MVAAGSSEGLALDPGLNGSSAPAVVSLKSATEPNPGQRVPAFSINGTTYYINTKPRVNAGLKYIHLARTKGAEIAIDYMLETLLGSEGYSALQDFDDLTEDDLRQVIDAASKIMAGAVEAPKGEPKNGSRKSRGSRTT